MLPLPIKISVMGLTVVLGNQACVLTMHKIHKHVLMPVAPGLLTISPALITTVIKHNVTLTLPMVVTGDGIVSLVLLLTVYTQAVV